VIQLKILYVILNFINVYVIILYNYSVKVKQNIIVLVNKILSNVNQRKYMFVHVKNRKFVDHNFIQIVMIIVNV
jgi:hypothetical protein